MKKLFVLMALIAYAFGDKCSQCIKECDNKEGLIKFIRISKCKNDCIEGPCLEN